MRAKLIVGLWVFATSAFGAQENALKCPAIENDIARLACFDEALKAISTDKADRMITNWDVKEEVSPVDDRKSLFASITATSATSSFIGKPDALLVLRCSEGTTSIFVASNAYFSDISNVTVRVDSSLPDVQTHMWDVSTSGNAIGLWQGRNPVTLAQSLKDNGKLAIRVEGRHSFEAVFDLGMIQPVKKRLGEMCNWKYY